MNVIQQIEAEEIKRMGKKLPEFSAKNRRPIDKAFVQSIFSRDHPGTADEATIEAFAEQILSLIHI